MKRSSILSLISAFAFSSLAKASVPVIWTALTVSAAFHLGSLAYFWVFERPSASDSQADIPATELKISLSDSAVPPTNPATGVVAATSVEYSYTDPNFNFSSTAPSHEMIYEQFMDHMELNFDPGIRQIVEIVRISYGYTPTGQTAAYYHYLLGGEGNLSTGDPYISMAVLADTECPSNYRPSQTYGWQWCEPLDTVNILADGSCTVWIVDDAPRVSSYDPDCHGGGQLPANPSSDTVPADIPNLSSPESGKVAVETEAGDRVEFDFTSPDGSVSVSEVSSDLGSNTTTRKTTDIGADGGVRGSGTTVSTGTGDTEGTPEVLDPGTAQQIAGSCGGPDQPACNIAIPDETENLPDLEEQDTDGLFSEIQQRFSSLTNIDLSGHAGTCPVFSANFTLGGKAFDLSSNTLCEFLEDYRTFFELIFQLVWLFAAIRVVLEA